MNIRLQVQGLGLVFLGAASYGILATIVKYSNNLGIHTSLLTLGQFLFGSIFLMAYAKLQHTINKTHTPPSSVRSSNINPKTSTENIPKTIPNTKSLISKRSKMNLMLFGTSTGLTSCFYYSSLQYITVSFAIVLLMQSIWMGVMLEAFIQKRKVQSYKIVGTLFVLIGTVLASNMMEQDASLNLKGLSLGLIAALSYTVTLYASSHIETQMASFERSKYLVFGGLLVIIAFWNFTIVENLNLNDWEFIKWGLLLAAFGTVLPPLLFTKGIPIIGIGMGAILASVELPVSILSAKFILNESMNLTQWTGVLLILISVIIVNKQNLKINTTQ